MKILPASIVASSLTLGIVAIAINLFPKIEIKATNQTTFSCLPYRTTTVVKQNDKVSDTMIKWDTEEFGDKYTPEKRCDIVTKRFNKAVRDNGGKLANLKLITGTIPDKPEYPVICVVNNLTEQKCKDENLLLTLNRENRKNPQEILGKITAFAFQQNGDNVIYENGGISFISLEAWVKTLEFNEPL